MELFEALHHAARQYCIEHAAIWHERETRLALAGRDRVPTSGESWTYTDEAYDTFPRHQTLTAVQHEVERFVPADFTSLLEARSLLAIAGETAQSICCEQTNPTAIAADRDERQKFVEFIHSVDGSRLSEQQPLIFRRVLGTMEHQRLHEAVIQKWGKWYGGCSDREFPESQVMTLHDAAMARPESCARIRDALHEHGIDILFELREYADGFEIPLESADFSYDGAEGFWTSVDLGWLIYASHESSITFAGTWLVEKIQAALPDFQQYLYKGWDPAAYA